MTFTCNGIIRLSIMAVVNVFSRVSTALCRKQTLVRAVPISFDAPIKKKRYKINFQCAISNLYGCAEYELHVIFG